MSFSIFWSMFCLDEIVSCRPYRQPSSMMSRQNLCPYLSAGIGPCMSIWNCSPGPYAVVVDLWLTFFALIFPSRHVGQFFENSGCAIANVMAARRSGDGDTAECIGPILAIKLKTHDG